MTFWSPCVLHPEWASALNKEFSAPYMQQLEQYLLAEYAQGSTIYPARQNIFAALNLTPLSQVKVVILGQDPYHGEGQAHGLSFSVQEGVALPPSLQNIFKELQKDLGIQIPMSGDLSAWAKQGVLLLNSVLTVRAGQAASHQNQGWELFTDAIIQHINNEQKNVVFLLWGNYAHRKGRMIDEQRHYVLKSVHPSPLSANRGGWFGNQHFSKTNTYLQAHHQSAIQWDLNNDR